jgi:RpiB/LacA/LacB family sugar-phosphate isomerase
MRALTLLEDFLILTDEEIQKFLREMSKDELSILLKGASLPIKEKMYINMSQNAIKLIRTNMEDLGYVKATLINSTIRESLKKINDIINADKLKVAIASDHAGFAMKEAVKEAFDDFDFIDFGPENEDSMDYPDTGFKAAEAVASGICEKGILICGSGIGMSIVANKVNGVRAALCHCTDFVRLTRQHNNANILVLPGRFLANHLAIDMVDTFFFTPYESGRHQKRLDKIKEYEESR